MSVLSRNSSEEFLRIGSVLQRRLPVTMSACLLMLFKEIINFFTDNRTESINIRMKSYCLLRYFVFESYWDSHWLLAVPKGLFSGRGRISSL